MRSSLRIHLRTTTFSFVYNWYATSSCELLLYADDTCLIFQHKYMTKIETALNKTFNMLGYWYVDNKSNIHFGEDKTKSVL